MYYDTSRYQIPHSTIPNADFVWAGAQLAELRPRDPTGVGHVLVEDVSRRKYLTYTDDLTLATNTTGIGGVHDTYAPLAANTAYDVRVAWDSLTSDVDGGFGLFIVPTGTVITANVLAALSGPDSYDSTSPVLGVILTDATPAIRPFTSGLDGWISLGTRVQVLDNGVSEVGAAIDCSAVVPNIVGCGVRWSAYAESSGVADRGVIIYQLVGIPLVQQTLGALANIAGSVKSATTSGTCYMRTAPATLLYYIWDGAPSVGLDLWIDAIHL